MENKNNLGFSLVELLVVISVISTISLIVFANYRSGERQFNLQTATYQLIQDIRRVENMAMTAQEVEGQAPIAYGIYFNMNDPTQYIIFADMNGNGVRDIANGDVDVETVVFEGWITDAGSFTVKAGVSITNLSPVNPLTITFEPPDPKVLIGNNESYELASIEISYPDGLTKTISVNKIGLVEVE